MITRLLNKIKRKLSKDFIYKNYDELMLSNGAILSTINKQLESTSINDFEFKIFSQWGEDGIIQKLINSIEVPNKTFIEFGVQNFRESNCRFLMMKDNWSGYIIDGERKYIDEIKESYYYWKYDLHAKQAFIDIDNIDGLLDESGFDYDLGILSIDIDGNDYHVLKAITYYKPRILICEFNSIFGDRKVSIPYDKNFVRTKAHYSNLYFGASLSAIVELTSLKGYKFVGVNNNCNNAFFVRNDVYGKKLREVSISECSCISKFREARDKTGKLSYISKNEQINLIKGMPILNIDTNEIELL